MVPLLDPQHWVLCLLQEHPVPLQFGCLKHTDYRKEVVLEISLLVAALNCFSL